MSYYHWLGREAESETVLARRPGLVEWKPFSFDDVRNVYFAGALNAAAEHYGHDD